MTAAMHSLQGFAYGEDRDGARSLGFKLLTPGAAPWAAEVETLARKLQACPYPEAWRPVELLCSVLLEGGQRLVALARYGLRDHTAGRRAGGLELLGVVGPPSLTLSEARAVVAWARRRRGEIDDLHSLGNPPAEATSGAALSGVVDSSPAGTLDSSRPVSPLPMRLAQSGALLITAVTPSQPDEHLDLLESCTSSDWQWIPLCGPDFPFDAYAQRGPLVAWTPARTDLAILLGRGRSEPAPVAPPRRASFWAPLAVAVLFVLLGLNLWAWWGLPDRLPPPPEPGVTGPAPAAVPPMPGPMGKKGTLSGGGARIFFGVALSRLVKKGAASKSLVGDEVLRKHYFRLVEEDPELRCDSVDGQAAIGAIYVLAARQPQRLVRIVEEELREEKGLDAESVRLICDRIRQRLETEMKVGGGGK
jgi:hypothetical protein